MINNQNTPSAQPLVSVIIPTYNGAAYLREAISSATPESQGIREVEIIVVDDQSKDNSHEIAKSFQYPVTAFRLSQNGGVANARNYGISKARGRYIALLDQDDIFLPNKLKEQVNIMQADSTLVLCHGNILVVNEHGMPIEHDKLGHQSPPPSGLVTKELFEWNHVLACTTLFRKDAFLKAGGFNVSLWGTDDYEMWLNLSLQGNFKYIDEIIAKYRWHDSNASKRDALMIFNRMSARTEFLKRNSGTSSKINSDFINKVLSQHTKDFSYNLTKMQEYALARKMISTVMQFISTQQKLSLSKIYLKTFIHQMITAIK